MSPASKYHSALQTSLAGKLAGLGGRAFVEASVLTPAGVFVADVAWASDAFMYAHSKRFELHGAAGLLERSPFAVHLSGPFDKI